MPRATRKPSKYSKLNRPAGKSAQVANNTKKINKIYKNLEHKFLDLSVGSNVILPTGEIITDNLTPIPQGTDEDERIGRKVTINQIFFKGNLILPETSTNSNTSDILRLVLYVDHQPNGAVPSLLDYFDVAEYDSFRNLANTKRFTVLYDRNHTLNASAAESTQSCAFIKDLKISKPKLNIQVNYDSTLGALTELTTRAIGFMGISQGGFIEIEGKWRIRYTDM